MKDGASTSGVVVEVVVVFGEDVVPGLRKTLVMLVDEVR